MLVKEEEGGEQLLAKPSGWKQLYGWSGHTEWILRTYTPICEDPYVALGVYFHSFQKGGDGNPNGYTLDLFRCVHKDLVKDCDVDEAAFDKKSEGGEPGHHFTLWTYHGINVGHFGYPYPPVRTLCLNVFIKFLCLI